MVSIGGCEILCDVAFGRVALPTMPRRAAGGPVRRKFPLMLAVIAEFQQFHPSHPYHPYSIPHAPSPLHLGCRHYSLRTRTSHACTTLYVVTHVAQAPSAARSSTRAPQAPFQHRCTLAYIASSPSPPILDLKIWLLAGRGRASSDAGGWTMRAMTCRWQPRWPTTPRATSQSQATSTRMPMQTIVI